MSLDRLDVYFGDAVLVKLKKIDETKLPLVRTGSDWLNLIDDQILRGVIVASCYPFARSEFRWSR